MFQVNEDEAARYNEEAAAQLAEQTRLVYWPEVAHLRQVAEEMAW